MNSKNILKLVVAVLIAEGAGLLGSFFTASSSDAWYASLAKPAVNPPSWVFGPVWTTLYLLMGIAAFLVWRRGLARQGVRLALAVYCVQLVFNVAWSLAFFGLQDVGLALIDIVLLWGLIVWTMVLFSKISRPAMYLLVPYLLWVGFATYLNFSIWRLN